MTGSGNGNRKYKVSNCRVVKYYTSSLGNYSSTRGSPSQKFNPDSSWKGIENEPNLLYIKISFNQRDGETSTSLE